MLARYNEEQWLAKRLPPPTDLLVQLGPLAVHSHQFVDAEGTAYRITSQTTASVEASGFIAVTRGRNLAAKAVGGLLVPGGVFVFGNRRERLHDGRELLFVLEDPAWQYIAECHPDAAIQVHELATAVRRAASSMRAYEEKVAALNGSRRALSGPEASPAKPLRADPVDQLSKLADLRDRGALTESEFEAAKTKILRDL